MSVAVLVITDGRQTYLEPCVASLAEQVTGPITERWMYDDTGDPHYRAGLAQAFPEYRHINAGARQGFAGAIRAAWAHLLGHSTAQWIWHVEQDFVFHRRVDLQPMVHVMRARPYLVQMALRRQAWSPAEHAAGGIVEQHPGDYTDTTDTATGYRWLEHRRFFTTNPCLYRAELMQQGWPAGPESEGHYGIRLRTVGVTGVPGDDVRFGFWGARTDAPWVTHIGEQRIGTGY